MIAIDQNKASNSLGKEALVPYFSKLLKGILLNNEKLTKNCLSVMKQRYDELNLQDKLQVSQLQEAIYEMEIDDLTKFEIVNFLKNDARDENMMDIV